MVKCHLVFEQRYFFVTDFDDKKLCFWAYNVVIQGPLKRLCLGDVESLEPALTGGAVAIGIELECKSGR